MEYLIGCDIGTTSVKAIAFTKDGQLLNTSSASYPMLHPQAGWAEQHPDQMVAATLEVLHHLIYTTKGKPLGLAFSAAMHGLMVLDATMKPLTNIIIWADNRSATIADTFRQTNAGRERYFRTGTPIHAMTPASKLMWLRENRPDLLQPTHYFCGLKEYLIYQLTGTFVCDYSLAAATGMLHLDSLTWDVLTLTEIGITPQQLPAVVSPYYVVPCIQKGPLQHLPLIMGGSDGCLANLGSGATEVGTLALTIGTSGAIRRTLHVPYRDPLMQTFCYPLSDTLYITGGPTNNGGVIIQWLQETFYPGGTINEVLQEAETVPIGADGLTFLPYLLGERAPIWNGHATGSFHGLTITHTRAHFARAVLEGVQLNLARIGKAVIQTDTIHAVFANGGFAQSDFLVQMLANILNLPIRLNPSNETGCTGAAMIGLKALGIFKDYSEMSHFVSIDKQILPDVAAVNAYKAIYHRFEQQLETQFSLV